MSIEAAIPSELNNKVGVGTRIWPDVVPDSNGKQSCIVYQRASTQYYNCFGADATPETARIQFDCYAMTKPESMSIAKLLINHLRNKSGDFGAGALKVTGSAVNIVDRDAVYEPETKRYRTRVDFMITFEG